MNKKLVSMVLIGGLSATLLTGCSKSDNKVKLFNIKINGKERSLFGFGGDESSESYTAYTTYILGEGAIGFEPVGAKVPYEMVRDAKTRGGEDTLISRKRNAVSVAGISYLKAKQATNSPTNAELSNGLNWSLVTDDNNKTIPHKAIPIARIISRG